MFITLFRAIMIFNLLLYYFKPNPLPPPLIHTRITPIHPTSHQPDREVKK